MNIKVKELLSLQGKVAVVTGGAGFLGEKHAEAIAEFGGSIVLVDIDEHRARQNAVRIGSEYNVRCEAMRCDITKKTEIELVRDWIMKEFGRIDILINNAALDPKVGVENENTSFNRLESLSLSQWDSEVAVGLTGAFLCAQVFGSQMATQRSGVIINIASDLAIIAPDQRLYEKPGLAHHDQPVKPVTYSVIKHGIIGLTKYLATYWGDQGVRANALCPGGVQIEHSTEFVTKISQLIPLRRMAKPDEYKAAIVFLGSDASSYMTGATLVMDGGRTIW